MKKFRAWIRKAVAPTAGRLALKLFLSVLVALGIIDDVTAVGILNDPFVVMGIVYIGGMIAQERRYRRNKRDYDRSQRRLLPPPRRQLQ